MLLDKAAVGAPVDKTAAKALGIATVNEATRDSLRTAAADVDITATKALDTTTVDKETAEALGTANVDKDSADILE